MSSTIYDVVVIGGGPIGLATAYEVAKAGKSVVVLEQGNFFNQAGSSNDLARMFRTMYTEDFMANLAHEAIEIWNELEQDSGESLRLMSGLLNFGDKDYGGESPEGTLMGPVPNLKRLKMDFKEYTAAEIEKKYPFKNLPKDWIGLWAPDNGVINVQLLLRTLHRMAKDYGAQTQQHTKVKNLTPEMFGSDQIWNVAAVKSSSSGSKDVTFMGKRIVITCGAYVNHVLSPSFGFSFELDIWEMASSYWNVNAGPSGTIFPSMWFQFSPDKDKRSQLFYGFPALPWGPPNIARISVDDAKNRISDPDQRRTTVISPEDVGNVQEFIKDHVVGADSTVPAFSLSCLQTNVFDNMFVLDFVPEKYLKGGEKNSVMVFTAGWAMKFVPLLGRALKQMAIDGSSDYARPEFKMTRTDSGGKGIIVDGKVEGALHARRSGFDIKSQASGSSMRRAV